MGIFLDYQVSIVVGDYGMAGEVGAGACDEEVRGERCLV